MSVRLWTLDADTHHQIGHLYRWWTVGVWRGKGSVTVKFGPVTFASYLWVDGHRCYDVALLGRWTLTTLDVHG